ncbi:uncharacterized protein LOC129144830 [Talpa occidentalis]|uniref:uncharacterized protein LOC129144830 n=1 Tax=Talpa occidentalis TaxID=50954 RepID=UPI0023F7FA18|nr:uncharacterized protein LOC129144830 [Talpa occidentalis]
MKWTPQDEHTAETPTASKALPEALSGRKAREGVRGEGSRASSPGRGRAWGPLPWVSDTDRASQWGRRSRRKPEEIMAVDFADLVTLIYRFEKPALPRQEPRGNQAWTRRGSPLQRDSLNEAGLVAGSRVCRSERQPGQNHLGVRKAPDKKGLECPPAAVDTAGVGGGAGTQSRGGCRGGSVPSASRLCLFYADTSWGVGQGMWVSGPAQGSHSTLSGQGWPAHEAPGGPADADIPGTPQRRPGTLEEGGRGQEQREKPEAVTRQAKAGRPLAWTVPTQLRTETSSGASHPLCWKEPLCEAG